MIEKVLVTVKKYGMLKKKDKVLIAVSGGGDSLALLFTLLELRDIFDLSLHVFHLNHMMRGKASDEDARFVEGLAGKLGLPATLLSYDVPSFIKKHKLSPEEGAREVRHMLLDKAASDVKADRIALGHTSDDQVETFLMRLIRGAGLEGLRAIPPVRGLYIRPLIEVSRDETHAFCRERNLKPRFDESNVDLSFLRNKIRGGLIPYIIKNYNPSFKEEVLREIQVISEDQALLEKLSEQQWKRVARHEEERVVLDRPKMLKFPLALRRRLLRKAILIVQGNLYGITFQHIEDVLNKVLMGESGASLDLPKGLIVYREYDIIGIAKGRVGKRLPPDFSVPLKIPGETEISVWNKRISAGLVPVEKAALPKTRDEAVFDFGVIKLPLVLRRIQAGDRFRPLGMKGEKKLQDFFVDEKIPREDREKALVVTTAGQIIWVVGRRIDDRFKLTEKTRQALILKVE